MVHFMQALVSFPYIFCPRFSLRMVDPTPVLDGNILRERVMYFLSGYILDIHMSVLFCRSRLASSDEPFYHLHIPVHAHHDHQPKVITRVLPSPPCILML